MPGRVALSVATLALKATSSETHAAGRSPGPPKAGTAVGTENRALVGDALELVVVGVGPYLDRRAPDGAPDDGPIERDLVTMLDVLAGAPVQEDGDVSVRAISGYARELQAVWDAWARIRPFDADETYRALDTAARLLLATGAEDEAATVRELATVPLALFAARALADYVAADASVDAVADALADAVAEPGGHHEAHDDETPADATPVDATPVDVTSSDAAPADEIPTDDIPTDDSVSPVRLRAVNEAHRLERIEDAHAPASVRALRVIDPALPLVTWSELSDTITALLATGRLDPDVLAGFTRKSLDERARAAAEGAVARGLTIRPEHVAWVISVLRTRYTGTARVTRAAATSLVAEYIAELAPRAGVDPRRVRQDMMAWVDVERA